MTDHEIKILLDEVPEFVPSFCDLVEAADGDPGAAAVFEELADFVAGLAEQLHLSRPCLVRCLSAVEAVARRSDDAEELVGWSFLDALSPDDRHLLGPWFGPTTRKLLAELDLE